MERAEAAQLETLARTNVIPVKRNLPSVVSAAAFILALPLPILFAITHREQVAAFGNHQGPGMLALIVLWVGSWTFVGVIAGITGMWHSFKGQGSRWLASLVTAANLIFFALQVRNLGLF